MIKREYPFNQNEPVENFDWAAYEREGVIPKRQLKINRDIVCRPGDKVFSTEPYAQEYYNAVRNCVMAVPSGAAKDIRIGTLYEISDIFAASAHEISVDTTVGMSAVIDLVKEKQFLRALGCPSISAFIAALRGSKEFKDKLLAMHLTACAVEGGRISLWGGHKVHVEAALRQEALNPTNFYDGYVVDTNVGGYIVDIQGVQCFMPGNFAPAGSITNPQALVGKPIRVMVINYLSNTNSFIVSFRHYVDKVLPGKLENEIYPGLRVVGKVTGCSSNAVFIQFKDSDGYWMFTSLIHRSTMSKKFEHEFNSRMIQTGDQMELFVANILPPVKEGELKRIVLTDSEDLVVYPEETDTEVKD